MDLRFSGGEAGNGRPEADGDVDRALPDDAGKMRQQFEVAIPGDRRPVLTPAWQSAKPRIGDRQRLQGGMPAPNSALGGSDQAGAERQHAVCRRWRCLRRTAPRARRPPDGRRCRDWCRRCDGGARGRRTPCAAAAPAGRRTASRRLRAWRRTPPGRARPAPVCRARRRGWRRSGAAAAPAARRPAAPARRSSAQTAR